jgi:hypothetical protein
MRITLTLAIAALAATAAAAPTTDFLPAGEADSSLASGAYGYNYLIPSGELINDGSFENGCGVNWSCVSDNECVWIADLVPLGLWNYDGSYVAWLGGFCGGAPTVSTHICQDVFLDGYELTWFWMAYVNDGGTRVQFSLDGEPFFEHVIVPADHLLGYQQEYASLPEGGETHTLCLDYSLGNAAGDNYFADYLEMGGIMPVQAASFSTVKARY